MMDLLVDKIRHILMVLLKSHGQIPSAASLDLPVMISADKITFIPCDV